MHRAFLSEWVILRYSPESKLEKISIVRKEQSRGVPLGRASVTGSRYPSFLPVAAAAVLAVVLAAPLSLAERADAGYWIDTWTASPQPIWDAEFPVPLNIPRALRNQTVRQIAPGSRIPATISTIQPEPFS